MVPRAPSPRAGLSTVGRCEPQLCMACCATGELRHSLQHAARLLRPQTALLRCANVLRGSQLAEPARDISCESSLVMPFSLVLRELLLLITSSSSVHPQMSSVSVAGFMRVFPEHSTAAGRGHLSACGGAAAVTNGRRDGAGDRRRAGATRAARQPCRIELHRSNPLPAGAMPPTLSTC